MAETTASEPSAMRRLRFGVFALDLRRAELTRDGAVVPLRPKPMALLTVFARQPGTVLTKEALLAAVWPGVVVSDDSLTQAVHDLRTALGEHGSALIRTIARRGYRFDAEVVDAETAEPTPGRGALPAPVARHSTPGDRALTLFGAALTLVLIAGVAAYGWLRPPSAPLPPPRSIVVLPLVQQGETTAGDWFADALTNDLTLYLGQCADTFVIARDTAHQYKGRSVDPRTVARELGVRHVVQGSVRRDNGRVELLLAMVDGATGVQQWAQRFSFDRARLTGGLDEVVAQLAATLNIETYRVDAARAAALSAERVEADDLALQANAIWSRGLTSANVSDADRLYRAAIARDVRSLRGWAGVANVEAWRLGAFWADDRRAALARLEQAVDRLRDIDASHAYTYMARLGYARVRDDWDAVLALADESIVHFPNRPLPHFYRGFASLMRGRFDECLEPGLRAVQLSPRDPILGLYLASIAACHLARDEFADAQQHAQRARQAGPVMTLPPLLLAVTQDWSGRSDEARRLVAEFRAKRPDYGVADFERLVNSADPAWLATRGRIVATLRSLGLP